MLQIYTCTTKKQFAEIQTNIADDQYFSVVQANDHANAGITLTVTVSTE
jgi:HPt (histidine-containing phosphotransfer) domain-containing protein